MTNTYHKTPIIRLLLPAIAGIIASTYCICNDTYSIAIAAIGIAVMILSNIKKGSNIKLQRWLWGAGINAFIFAIFCFSNTYQTKQTTHTFDDKPTHYIGTIYSTPQEKAKSTAYQVNLTYPTSQKIIAYIQREDTTRQLSAGEEIIFASTIEPIKNSGNPNAFDYKAYMQNKGFAGSTYIPTILWKKTGRVTKNIMTYSIQWRQKAIEMCHGLNLRSDAKQFITALILGYKEELSDNIKEAFQASGTAHILAVSGLHVGIVYSAIALLFALIGRNKRTRTLKYILIIITLWAYAILTGLSPSVVRASIMLTVAIIGKLFTRRLNIYNTLAVAAFLILVFNPKQLYDVGFQLSFTAVAAIVAINPILLKVFNPKNKVSYYITNLFTVSLSAQVGVLPITLYYFGAFPTYFFIANMLIIPAIPIIVYASIITISIAPLLSLGIPFITPIYNIIKGFLELLIRVVLRVVHIIESMPMSQITDIHISITQTIIAIMGMALMISFIRSRKPSRIIGGLTCTLLLALTFSYYNVKDTDNQLVIYNTSNKTDIALLIDNTKTYFETPNNGFIPHNNKRILILSDNRIQGLKTSIRLDIDILILSNDKTFNIAQINQLINFKQLVIDRTTPLYIRKRWIEQCTTLGIETHDVSQNGAFFIKL